MAYIEGLPDSHSQLTVKYLINFSIQLLGTRRPTANIQTTDADLFHWMRERLHDGKSINPVWFGVCARHDHPDLRVALEELRTETGRQPCAEYGYYLDHRDTRFSVDVTLVPDESDLQSCRWLWISSHSRLAVSDRVNEDDSYVVQKVSGPRKTPAYGNAFSIGTMALFNAPLKEAILQSSLRDFEFRSVKKTNGTDSGLWQLWSPTIMPPEACPINSAYQPLVMKYEEKDVAALPDFDVAFATEKPPLNNPGLRLFWPRRILVSQRFREVAETMVPGQIKYGLVAVGKGEELKRRYTLPELSPPEAL